MSIFSVGRLCLKIAGRDAGRHCVVVEEMDSRFVLVDGNVRRKKVNTVHLEPLADVVQIKSGASHEDVKNLFSGQGWPVWETKAKKVAAKPIHQRKAKKVAVKVPPKKAPVKEAATEKVAKAEKKE